MQLWLQYLCNVTGGTFPKRFVPQGDHFRIRLGLRGICGELMEISFCIKQCKPVGDGKDEFEENNSLCFGLREAGHS